MGCFSFSLRSNIHKQYAISETMEMGQSQILCKPSCGVK